MVRCGTRSPVDDLKLQAHNNAEATESDHGSIRKFGLHPPHEETRVDDKGLVDMTSFIDTVMAISGNQAAEAHLSQACQP